MNTFKKLDLFALSAVAAVHKTELTKTLKAARASQYRAQQQCEIMLAFHTHQPIEECTAWDAEMEGLLELVEAKG